MFWHRFLTDSQSLILVIYTVPLPEAVLLYLQTWKAISHHEPVQSPFIVQPNKMCWFLASKGVWEDYVLALWAGGDFWNSMLPLDYCFASRGTYVSRLPKFSEFGQIVSLIHASLFFLALYRFPFCIKLNTIFCLFSVIKAHLKIQKLFATTIKLNKLLLLYSWFLLHKTIKTSGECESCATFECKSFPE